MRAVSTSRWAWSAARSLSRLRSAAVACASVASVNARCATGELDLGGGELAHGALVAAAGTGDQLVEVGGFGSWRDQPGGRRRRQVLVGGPDGTGRSLVPFVGQGLVPHRGGVLAVGGPGAVGGRVGLLVVLVGPGGRGGGLGGEPGQERPGRLVAAGQGRFGVLVRGGHLCGELAGVGDCSVTLDQLAGQLPAGDLQLCARTSRQALFLRGDGVGELELESEQLDLVADLAGCVTFGLASGDGCLGVTFAGSELTRLLRLGGGPGDQ